MKKATIRALLLFLSSMSAIGATINALSPGLTDVSNAIAQAASSGDTIVVPAGSASWSAGLVTSKAFILQGAGTNLTTITDEITVPDGNGVAILDITTTTNAFVRITGIHFAKGTASVDYSFGTLWFRGSGLAIRVDNCWFDNLRNNSVFFGDRTCGVVDHCRFDVSVNNHGVEVHHYDWQPWSGSQAYGDGSWSTPFGWGTTNMVVIEDCSFTKPDGNAAIDTFDGARWCARFCTFTNAYLEIHGTDSGGRYRGGRGAEVYSNIVAYSSSWGGFLHVRSGSAVCFGNTIIGPISYSVELNGYRLFGDVAPYHAANRTNAWDVSSNVVYYAGTHKGAAVSGHYIDTNAAWTVNQWVGFVIVNTNQGGLFTQSAITANTATDCTFTLAASAGFTASSIWSATNGGSGLNLAFTNGQGAEFQFVRFLLDGPGSGSGDALVGGSSTVNPTPTTWPNQAREPVYAWGNSGIANANTINNSYYKTAIQAGSEFNSNTTKPGYTPLAYPHPLVGGSPPTPPTDLKIFTVGGRMIKL